MSEEERAPEEADEKAAEPAVPAADASPASSSDGGDDAPAKKKKKKKKADATADAGLDDPRAAAIAVAFEAGNFVRVRELGAELKKSDDPVLVSIGQDYLARIAVDPIQLAFIGLCAAAILTIAWIYIPH